MLLELNGIDVHCIIGDLPEERVSPQNLRVDLRLEIPDDAAKSDSLSDTVDYAKLTEDVRATLIDAKCRMIERAAYLVAQTASRDKRVKSVEVRVTKSGAIPHLRSATATYQQRNQDTIYGRTPHRQS